MPAMDGSPTSSMTRAQCAKRSSGPVMNVGKKRVTPVAFITGSARLTSSTDTSGELKSTPPKPFT